MACLKRSSSFGESSQVTEEQSVLLGPSVDSPGNMLLCFYQCLNVISWNQIFRGNTCVTNKPKPLFPHLNLDDALLPQLRMDRGELSSKSEVMDHLLDIGTQVSSSLVSIHQDNVNCIFTLVAFCRAACAKLQNLCENVNFELESM